MLKLLILHLWAVLLGKASRPTHNGESLRESLLINNSSQALSTEPPPPLPGYRVQDFRWEVPISTTDGRTAILNGTIQEVYRQVLELNPSYEDEFGTTLEHRAKTSRSQIQLEARHLRMLEDTDRNSRSECGRFDPAREDAVWEGIDHLAHVSGRPVSAPGPGVCGRVSCSYDSAIWWCNDMFTDKTLSSFNEIGASVQVLAGNCAYWSDERGEPHVSGQQSHVDRWRTIVREAAC